MTKSRTTTTLRRGGVPLLAVLLVLLGTTAARAQAPAGSPAAIVPALAWTPCGLTQAATAVNVQCAVAALPMDYDKPAGVQVHLAVAKVPARDKAHRLGSLFFNLGGPGAASVSYLQAAGAGLLASLNQRFDVVGFDPRGAGQSTPAIDCHVNQETQGLASQPFPTPLTIDPQAFVAKAQGYVNSCRAANGTILGHLSTANVARDMDALRAAVGDKKLSYIGFSYGTFLGTTYAALFPGGYRAMVLDGDVDAAEYIHDPTSDGIRQTAAFERALGRFFEACAADQTACSRFGGADPRLAFDHLVQAAEAKPIPATAYTADPRPVDGDDIRYAAVAALYAKRFWGTLALVLAKAAAGDGSLVRAVVDGAYGRQDDGSFDPSEDRFFAITASEQQYRRNDPGYYLARGADAWAAFPHFWWNTGYPDVDYTLWPVHDADAYAGPWTLPSTSPTPLLISTTYDPATPYEWGKRLAAELGNARLLTMDGDGHTAFANNSPCAVAASAAYLVDLTLPAPGTVCTQDVPFTAPTPATAAAARARIATTGPFGVPLGR
jgi:pimeloyl-ACP methyl ester carboxylesterase